MPTQVLKDVAFFLAEFDFTAEMNEVSLSQEIEIPDATVFKSGRTRQYTPGLRGVAGVHHGWYDNDDESLSGGGEFFTNIGQQLAGVHTILPDGGFAAGEVAYFFEASESKFSINGSLGELFGFDLEFSPRGDLIRGRVMDDADTLHTASRTGASQQLGTQVVGTNIVYAVMHVVAFDGDTLDVVVRSDGASNMATPTTRITFPQVDGVIGLGPLTFAAGTTDTWWDVDLTFVGTSFRACIVVGIQ